MKVLVTGASGFVGRRLCDELAESGHTVRALVRSRNSPPFQAADVMHGDVTDATVAATATGGMDAVIHLAARAHVMMDHAPNPLAEYRRVNVGGTRLMLNASAKSGVLCFIFASSVKAVGETSTGKWNTFTVPKPVDPYGTSKLEAESLMRGQAKPMSTCILRFPLIYGPGMRGNMLRLFELIDQGWPLPVGADDNARSLLFVGNATAAIRRVLQVAAARESIQSSPLFVADGPSISTAELIERIAAALGTSARTIRLRENLLRGVARVSDPFTKATLTRILNRLLGSLEVDQHEFEDAYDFTPPYTTQKAMEITARWFRQL